jgi:hypothetical protein
MYRIVEDRAADFGGASSSKKTVVGAFAAIIKHQPRMEGNSAAILASKR